MELNCCECKDSNAKKMQIDKNNLDTVIRFDKVYYHYDCFVKACERKSKKSSASPKWGLALKNLEAIQEETKAYLKTSLVKDEINQLMLNNYNTTAIPSTIYTKLEDIYHGRWKGLARGIPPEDLLDMWTQKRNYLTKVRMKNITLGKEMTGAQQINYDISVLVNMYDDYLKWKERNKIIEQDVNKVHTDILKKVDLDKLSKIAQNQKKEEDDDIDSLLEELFD